MEGPERVVCCTLCLCMAVAVFSSVALVYLTALVYVPAKREINSGLLDVPVVCTTIERIETDDCTWFSCGEWCLSKSSHCVKLWAQVRRNGTDLRLEGCTNVRDVTCTVLDSEFVNLKNCDDQTDCDSVNERFTSKCGPPYNYCDDRSAKAKEQRPLFTCEKKSKKCVSSRQYRNCKEDLACVRLNQFWLCEDSLCQNITSVYDCDYFETEKALDCTDKRNCIELNGLYHCVNGYCSKGMIVITLVGLASICATAYCYARLVAFNRKQEEEDKRVRAATYAAIFVLALVALGAGVASDPAIMRMAASKLGGATASAPKPSIPMPSLPSLKEPSSSQASGEQKGASGSSGILEKAKEAAQSAGSTQSGVGEAKQGLLSGLGGGDGGASGLGGDSCQGNMEGVTKVKFWFNIATFVLAAYLLFNNAARAGAGQPDSQQQQPRPISSFQ